MQKIKNIFLDFYNKHPAWLCFIIFLIMGLWQFQEGLFYKDRAYVEAYVRNNYTSDAIGIISGIGKFYNYVNDNGIKVFFSSSMLDNFSNVGLDKARPAVNYWSLYDYILSVFFNFDKVWNIQVFITFLLIAMSGFLLARTLGMNVIFSIITAYFLTHLENFEFRMNNHGGLVGYHYCILLIWSAYNLGKVANLKNCLIFSLILFLNCLNHAYYFYFGFFFCLVFILGYWVILKTYKQVEFKKLIINISSGAFLFAFCFIISFPKITIDTISPILGLSSNFNTGGIENQVIRPYQDFNYWSLHNIFSIWQTGITWLRNFFPFTHFNNPIFPTESFYRTGFLAFVLLFALRFYLINKNPQNNKIKCGLLGNEIYVWIAACFVMIAFSVNDSYFFSLVPFSYNLIKAFRVGIRALTFYEISVIVLFLYTLNLFYDNWKNSKKTLYISILLIIVYADVISPSDSIYPKIYKARLAPVKDAYLVLSEKPKGLLLELPMSSEKLYPNWENEYLYSYYQPWHKKIVVNPFSNAKVIPEYFREKMLNVWNNMSASDLENLRLAGVRYIAVHPSRVTEPGFDNLQINFSIFANNELLNLVSSDSFTFIFEFKEPITTQNNFLEIIKSKYE